MGWDISLSPAGGGAIMFEQEIELESSRQSSLFC